MADFSLQDFPIRYGFCDPAGGKGAKGRETIKRARARAAIITVAADPHLERIFVLEAWAGRVTTPVLRDRLLDSTVTFGHKIFGIEDNAMQSLWVAEVREHAKKRGIRVPIQGVTQSTRVEKDFRIRASLQPVIGEGRLILGPNQDDLRAELLAFPLGQTKDLVDALASAISLIPRKARHLREKSSRDALRDYLRRCGLSDWQVERRVAEVVAAGGGRREEEDVY